MKSYMRLSNLLELMIARPNNKEEITKEQATVFQYARRAHRSYYKSRFIYFRAHENYLKSKTKPKSNLNSKST